MSFAAKLTQVVAKKQDEQDQREKMAARWEANQDVLLEKAVELFKTRCIRIAELQKTQVTVSFEALTRDIPGFPSRELSDGLYYVKQWAESDGITAESWFYFNNGTTAAYTGARILFAQVLEFMMEKFVEKLQKLGFSSCRRETGTWRITAEWEAIVKEDKVERPLKKAKRVSVAGGA